MIVMFSDFGLEGPYVGQMQGAMAAIAPEVPCLSLMHDAPAFNPKASAYLLAATASYFPEQTFFLSIVDPGVGTGRKALVLRTERHTFVGPDNGLLAIAARRAATARWSEIIWHPMHLSASFHGRDLFAPVVAMLAAGVPVEEQPYAPEEGHDWPDDLAEVVYQDGYGNLMTGLRAGQVPQGAMLSLRDQLIAPARTFADMPVNSPFWYENSQGLIEIAANRASAAELLWAEVGTPVLIGRSAVSH